MKTRERKTAELVCSAVSSIICCRLQQMSRLFASAAGMSPAATTAAGCTAPAAATAASCATTTAAGYAAAAVRSRRTGSACACSTTASMRNRYRMCAATAGHLTTAACARRTAATAGHFTAAAAARSIATRCCRAAAAPIASTTAINEPMPAPAVAITPAGPWAHAQEDPVIEVSRPVEPIGRAGIRRIVVIAVLANRLNTNAYANHNLRLRRRRQGHTREQCCSTEKKLESAHVFDPPLRCLRFLVLREIPYRREQQSSNSSDHKDLWMVS